MNLIPDPDALNKERAEWGMKVMAFCDRQGESQYFVATAKEIRRAAEDKLADLIADLAHYCDREGLSMVRVLRKAEVRYNASTENQGPQFRA